MNSRVKRSDTGYGLRRVLTKRRWDEDFEYYFSKISSEDPSENTPENSANVTEVAPLTKRPVGRPRKHPLSTTKYVGDLKEETITDSPSEPIKRVKEIKSVGDDKNNLKSSVVFTLTTLDVKKQDVCKESHEVTSEGIVEDLETEADILTGLREEEVSSVPEGEKENMSDEGDTIGSDSEDVMGHMSVDAEDGTENIEVETTLTSPKMKRQYRRNCLSDDMLRKLSELGSDDKIECNMCHKLLKPSSFRQHVRTHYGVKPFGCYLCEAKFTRKGDVERHIRIVHNKDKPFKCCKCQRGFGDRRNLRWHLKNHDKKLFYVCEVCGFKFGKRVYWENHVRYIHPLPKSCSELDTAEEDEDCNLHSATETLLAESEGSVDDPNEEISIMESAVESIPNNDNLLSETENLDTEVLKFNNSCDVKNVSYINAKDCKLWQYSTPEEGVETVVIHLKPPNEEEAVDISQTKLIPKTLVYQIDSPQEILEILQKDCGEHNMPTTSDVVYDETDNTERLVEVAVGEEGVRSVEYVNDFCNTSKVCRITLSEDHLPLHRNSVTNIDSVHQTDHKPIHYKLTKIQAS